MIASGRLGIYNSSVTVTGTGLAPAWMDMEATGELDRIPCQEDQVAELEDLAQIL